MEYKTYSRTKMVEEILLRENIRKALEVAVDKRNNSLLKEHQKLSALRALVKELILEAETEIAPHESTGINVLEDLLKKIVPQLEGDFKTLTTNTEQRDSFRAHILNATENSIAPQSATRGGDAGGEPLGDISEMEEEEVMTDAAPEAGSEEMTPPPMAPDPNMGDPPEAPMEEIEVKVDSSDEEPEEVEAGDITSLDDDEKLIDIGDNTGGQDADDAFEDIAGQDDTGRNVANMSFQKIEKSIQDSYALLGDPADQDLFRDYLLTNLKLYFDKFEDELGAGGEEEPTTPEYEEEKGEAAETEEAGGEDAGDEEELELDI